MLPSGPAHVRPRAICGGPPGGRGIRSGRGGGARADREQGGGVAPRSPADRSAVERAVAELIRSLGLDRAQEPELERTPDRVAALYAEIFSGLDPANEPQLAVFPHRGGDDLV